LKRRHRQECGNENHSSHKVISYPGILEYLLIFWVSDLDL